MGLHIETFEGESSIEYDERAFRNIRLVLENTETLLENLIRSNPPNTELLKSAPFMLHDLQELNRRYDTTFDTDNHNRFGADERNRREVRP